jgi:hypothetical protein
MSRYWSYEALQDTVQSRGVQIGIQSDWSDEGDKKDEGDRIGTRENIPPKEVAGCLNGLQDFRVVVEVMDPEPS